MSKSGKEIDIATIRKFKADDMSAFDIIYRTYYTKILNFAHTLIKIRSDAEEIVHDVFLKVWVNREKIDEHSSFESYLFTITYNTTISILRKRGSENQYLEYLKSIQNTSPEQNFGTEIEFTELKVKSDQIIDHLPSRQQQVYKLSREKGLTYKEIAKALDISQNTVEKHMERALQTIRKKLGEISIAVLIYFCLFI